ncbi:hypothetical protein EDB80DRAFT_755692 [Ilyonectria destructans]|nr:hypothetical protein EDB80DRAFT_755692 [Ilyonectria destructans]
MNMSLQDHAAFIGSKVDDLPTSALVVTKSIVESNIAQLHSHVEALEFGFRPHVDTLKTLEMTRMMLGNGKYRSIVCSTLAEIEWALPLAEEGALDEVIYGVPFAPSELFRLSALRPTIRIILLIDSRDQIVALESFMSSNPSTVQSPWPVFLEIDVGARWAGVPSFSERIESLVHRSEECKAVEVLGFHADARFASSEASKETCCAENLEGVLEDTGLLGTKRKVVVSIQPAPTYPVRSILTAKAPMNVVLQLDASQAPANVVELHPSNPPLTHLQHIPESFVDPFRQALRLVTEVCSVYPERNEALIKTGPPIVSKEGSEWRESGNIVGKPGWRVRRMAKGHGVVGTGVSSWDAQSDVSTHVEENFKLGDKVLLQVTHACMAALSHTYFVVDDNDVVKETWVCSNLE